MGLSSKQVSSGDRLDWGQVLMTAGTTLELSKPPPPSMRRQQQHQQQQLEPLKCPRCDSVNTKFCYYNNYNKTQPRHFCKACKRHWTKGGTLRNVPVGGGRKNKRLKTSNTTTSTTTTTTTTATATATVAINNDINRRNNTPLAIHQTHNHHHQNVPIVLADHQKSLSDILYQTFIRSPYSLQHDSINNSRSNSSNNNFNGSKNNGIFLGSSSTTPLLSLPQEPNLQFPFSSSSTSFESNPSSISTSFQPSNVYNYIGKSETTEDSTITHLMPTAAAAATSNSINITHQPWQHVPTTISSSLTDMPASYWNWDDINTFVSTDLNLPWDDFELKP